MRSNKEKCTTLLQLNGREIKPSQQFFNIVFLFQPLFAYECNEHYEENGWQVYDAAAEFKRQGLPNEWKITRLNDKFELCDTYPTVVSTSLMF